LLGLKPRERGLGKHDHGAMARAKARLRAGRASTGETSGRVAAPRAGQLFKDALKTWAGAIDSSRIDSPNRGRLNWCVATSHAHADSLGGPAISGNASNKHFSIHERIEMLKLVASLGQGAWEPEAGTGHCG
jgi:hypothetical protein